MSTWYFDTFHELLTEIELELRDFCFSYPKVADNFWQMIYYHFGWDENTDGTQQNLPISGKRVRPLLTCLVSNALSGGHRHVLPAAAAIELIHNFTLIHDDIMDQSLERRHRPTLWSKWGAGQTINAGDGLHALAMSAITRADAPAETLVKTWEVISHATVAVAQGQMLDVSFETRDDVTTSEYVEMVSNKTASLIECSTRIGALFNSEDDAVIDAYARFGRGLGIAFQIWDDFLGIWGQTEITGKPTGIDVAQKKKSYPVVFALEKASRESKEKLLSVFQKPSLEAQDIEDVIAIIDSSGARLETQKVANAYYEEAIHTLERIRIDNSHQRQLFDLASFLVNRAF